MKKVLVVKEGQEDKPFPMSEDSLKYVSKGDKISLYEKDSVDVESLTSEKTTEETKSTENVLDNPEGEDVVANDTPIVPIEAGQQAVSDEVPVEKAKTPAALEKERIANEKADLRSEAEGNEASGNLIEAISLMESSIELKPNAKDTKYLSILQEKLKKAQDAAEAAEEVDNPE